MLDELEARRKSILEAMNYAVPETHRMDAEDLLDLYREDSIALILLQEFYNFLPEAEEDWVRELRVVNQQRGIFLLEAQTAKNSYLYLVSHDGIEFQGSVAEGFCSDEVLDFFGYEDAAALIAHCACDLPIYEALRFNADICPACHAVSGEYHELGCPVEICPWCGGQLVHCDCRYEQLGLDAMVSEADLLRFEEMLEERGRLAYSPEQRPSFAGEDPEVSLD